MIGQKETAKRQVQPSTLSSSTDNPKNTRNSLSIRIIK